MFLCKFSHTFLYLFRRFTRILGYFLCHKSLFIIIAYNMKSQTLANAVSFQCVLFFNIFPMSLVRRYN